MPHAVPHSPVFLLCVNDAHEDVLSTSRQLFSSWVSAHQGEVAQLALRAFLQACDQHRVKG